jgi:hypothetical protein
LKTGFVSGICALVCFFAGVSAASAATFQIPRLTDAEEGRGYEVAVMARIAHAGVKNEPSGEARVRLGWTPEALQVFVRVFDPDRFEMGKLYRGDSVELFVSPEVGAPDYLQVIAAPGITGSKYPEPRYEVLGYGALEGAKLPVTVTGGPDQDGYVLEVAVPWKNLGIQAEAGRKIGFQIVINDRDVEMAQIGDYVKRNNEIDHLCWFPDRTTAFDQTRMYTLVLGDEAGPARITWTDLQPSRLEVGMPFALAGKTVSVAQGPNELGQAILQSDTRVRLARGSSPLKPFDPHGEALELRVDGEVIDRVPLYERSKGEISRILSTADEVERLTLLRELEKTTTDPLLREDIHTLLPLVEIWAEGRKMAEEGRLKVPAEYLLSTVNPMSPPAIREDSPLFPLYCLFRARNLIWRSIQGGYPREVAENFTLARTLLAKAKAVVPDNALINMYLGEPQPWPAPAPDPNAPKWANDQRHALEKLREIVHWWIDERQMANGSFGGGWNDDVEMWRNWWPVLLAFQDEKAEAAQTLISSAILDQPHMTAGYSSVMEDVEHSSEDSADALTPMLYLRPKDPLWGDKARNIARLTREVWTAKNDRGNLSFKNIVSNSKATSKDPKNAYDTTLDVRAVQPAFVYWQSTRDPELTALFAGWLSTWVEAAASDGDGKPAGVLPTAIHFPDQRIGGPHKWWNAEAFSFLYNWPHYVGDMLHVLVMTWHRTGDDKFLAPLRSMAALRKEYLARHPEVQDREPIGFVSFGRY